MRFGLFIPQGWRQDLVGIDPPTSGRPCGPWLATRTPRWSASASRCAQRVESLWVYDHFHTVPEPTGEATHEAWTLMAAFAASTERIRLGQMCTCIAYRNPAYLAKVAATVDIVSGGRTEMGIGAGWYEHEWRAYGHGFPARVRLGALDEGVQVMEQMWRTGSATLDGTYFQIDGAQCHPQPLQVLDGVGPDGGSAPSIPLWIAGGGEKKTLRIAAQHAQYTNFDGSLEGFSHKSEVLRGHCEAIGRPFEQITRSSDYNVVIGATEADVEDRLRWIGEHYAKTVPAKAEETVQEFRSGPLVGTPEQIVETLQKLEGAGMTYAITYFAEAAYDRSGIELFEREVVPALQG
ncbi:TIGR03560 family F420-dependent LLM class oxidoreductase [Oerskovia sp. M15]